jgi:hypothetical protein
MATYTELEDLRATTQLTDLRKKIDIALAIKANTIAKLTTPTANQAAFAIAALRSPESYRELVLNYILAEYNTTTTTAIIAATDAQVQSAVNATVDTLLAI